MCGICGVYNYRSQREVDRDKLQKMADSIKHRGPNAEGFYFEKNVGLGHRRLSIIDKAGGGQPMFNEDGKIAIVFNGEIYNHHALRQDLIEKGHIFKTHSDTEAIIHSYEEMGERCVEQFRGMFAFALWDSREKKLLLARDRVGIKPLLYAITEEAIFFSSEMKALLVGGIQKEIDEEALSDYITYRYVPAPRTILKNVYRLLPGHTLVITADGIQDRTFWDLDFSKESSPSIPEACAQVKNLLSECVESHLESEVPLGAFLSGGVDSSAVVAMMSNFRKNDLKTFTIGFDQEEYDETPYARKVAELYHTRHHERIVESPSPQDFDLLLDYFDEPFADSSSLPTFAVCREAAREVTVVLSGDGGDENFGGYRRYYFSYAENCVRAMLPSFVRKGIVYPLSLLYPKADWLPRFLRAKRTLEDISRTPDEAYYASVIAVQDKTKAQMLSADFTKALGGYRSFQKFKDYYDKADTKEPLKKIFYADIKMYLSGDILTKVDLASMAHSIEVRVPILDHHMVEYAFQLPLDLKLKEGAGKYIFKETLKDMLPHNILHRSKMGFSIPLDHWLRHELAAPFRQEVIERGHLPYFDYKNIERLYRQNLVGFANYRDPLWNLWVFHRWYQKYMV